MPAGTKWVLAQSMAHDAVCPTLQQAASGLGGTQSDLASSDAAQEQRLSRCFCWTLLDRCHLVQGFSMPTPIQEACLMPAIQGRRDIIGAAQTVRS